MLWDLVQQVIMYHTVQEFAQVLLGLPPIFVTVKMGIAIQEMD